MPIPFLVDELFKLSNNILPYVEDGVIIIDDAYENFDDIVSILKTIPAPNWKISKKGRNFKDYYDCRPIINNFGGPNTDWLFQVLSNLIKTTYFVNSVEWQNKNKKTFNAFKIINIPDINKNMQAKPHTDSKFAAITTFDFINSGGTAIYDINLELAGCSESENIFFDVTNIPKKIIQSKPNRMIIFEASRYHGAYVEDYSKYLNDWRINEVLFFN